MADSTLANALSEHARFGLKRAKAKAEMRCVAAVVDGWQAHFARVGITARDIESLVEQIDRPLLREQRMP